MDAQRARGACEGKSCTHALTQRSCGAGRSRWRSARLPLPHILTEHRSGVAAFVHNVLPRAAVVSCAFDRRAARGPREVVGTQPAALNTNLGRVYVVFGRFQNRPARTASKKSSRRLTPSRAIAKIGHWLTEWPPPRTRPPTETTRTRTTLHDRRQTQQVHTVCSNPSSSCGWALGEMPDESCLMDARRK